MSYVIRRKQKNKLFLLNDDRENNKIKLTTKKRLLKAITGLHHTKTKSPFKSAKKEGASKHKRHDIRKKIARKRVFETTIAGQQLNKREVNVFITALGHMNIWTKDEWFEKIMSFSLYRTIKTHKTKINVAQPTFQFDFRSIAYTKKS